jgi:hypothetical protein
MSVECRGRKVIAWWLAGLMLILVLNGCNIFTENDEGEEVAYDLCDDSMLPEELAGIITTKKEDSFKLTFSNNTYTYIVVCEGMQNRTDVEVELDELYTDGNAIYVKTVLRQMESSGVTTQEADTVSFPYTVIRIKKTELPIIFK